MSIGRTVFDASVPLDPGVTVVEASAGTGKTYGITTLIVRFLVELGVDMEEILVVTFTRAATAELKARVHARLANARRVLRDPTAKVDDDLKIIAARCRDRGESEEAARRIDRALSILDAASISTIHGFCQRMLRVNAFESGVDFDLELVEDATELLEELVDDYLVGQFHDLGVEEYRFLTNACKMERAGLMKVARAITGDPGLQILPEPDSDASAGFDTWCEAVAAFRRTWERAQAEARAALSASIAAGELNKGSYKPKLVEERWQTMNAWLRKGGPPAAMDRLEFFSSRRIEGKTKKGKTSAAAGHELFVAWDAFNETPPPETGLPRANFARWVREEFDRRKRARGIQTFQDLLRSLADGIEDDAESPLARAIRARYRVALIDEFQDTDAVQWSIFSRVFSTRDRYLYLIGDPKQSIYGFRGANVHVYLDACRQAGRILDMDQNWRSDARFTTSMNHALEQPGLFGEEEIKYRRVRTPAVREPADRFRVRGPAGPVPGVPLRVRFVDKRILGGEAKQINWGDASPALAHDMAADVVRFLDAGAELWEEGTAWRPVSPGDLAVLVRTNREAVLAQEALRTREVPSVIGNSGSIFGQAEALYLLRWLGAVIQPRNGLAARSAAGTPLFGWDAAALVRAREGEDEGWGNWIEELSQWRDVLEKRGFMAAFRQMLAAREVTGRLLGLPAGERRLTNLLHVAELCHAASSRERLGMVGLEQWLAARITEALDEPDRAGEESHLVRLETDDVAVRIVTIHKSKGLEYPFVWIPFLAKGSGLGPMAKGEKMLVAPNPEALTARVLDLRHRRPDPDPILESCEAESFKERVRLLYVALTRARHGSVIHWGPVREGSTSPLAVVFHGGEMAAAKARVKGADPLRLFEEVEEFLAPLGDMACLELCGPPDGGAWAPADEDRPGLRARPFTRPALDRIWGLSSFTAMARGAPGAHRSLGVDDPARPGFDGDGLVVEPATTGDEVPGEGPLGPFPGGVVTGIFLHELLEKLDFRALHPEENEEKGQRVLAESIAKLLPGSGIQVDPETSAVLTPGLTAALRTPLGGAAGDLRLCDLASAERLDELDFHFAMAGGTRWGSRGHRSPVTSRELAAAFAQRPGDEAMRADYIRSLEDLAFDEAGLAGFMRGSIDLVFRAEVEGQTRWFLADYKSNRLGGYDLPRLRAAMEKHHYYLQYHLYSLALHRFLRWRLGAEYDYERDFGGAYYLFLRGMVGEPESGVFFDRPDPAVLAALDRLFEGGTPAEEDA